MEDCNHFYLYKMTIYLHIYVVVILKKTVDCEDDEDKNLVNIKCTKSKIS